MNEYILPYLKHHDTYAISQAIATYQARLATADDATQRTLLSVWKPEILNATHGDSEAIRRLLEVWGNKQ